jgi:hypothetical protein
MARISYRLVTAKEAPNMYINTACKNGGITTRD